MRTVCKTCGEVYELAQRVRHRCRVVEPTRSEDDASLLNVVVGVAAISDIFSSSNDSSSSSDWSGGGGDFSGGGSSGDW